MVKWPPSCSWQQYLEATTVCLLREAPEFREELLSHVDPIWRMDFLREVERQSAPDRRVR